MKILQINKYYYRRGGSESVFFNTMDLLRRNGHEVVPFSAAHPKNLECEYSRFFPDVPEIRDCTNFDKIRAIPRFFYSRESQRMLDRLLDETRPDVAHLHNIFNGLSLSILPALARHNVPVVITLHDTRFICPTTDFLKNPRRCENCKKTFFTNCLIHKCYEDSLANSFFVMLEMMHKEYLFNYDKYIDRYIFLNSHYLNVHARRHSFFKEKSEVLYNFYPSEIQSDFKHDGYFLYYGRMTREKGVETLMRAARHLPDVKFKFAGTGPMLETLKAMNLSNVDFLGFLTGEELERTIRGAKFIVVPSEWEENNPMTVIEGNSMGKPVIGSDRKGIMEIVRQGSTGFIFPEANLERLIDMLKLCNAMSEGQYEMMSANALAFAHTNFSSSGYYSRLMDIYGKAIERHKR